ncbi:hypothetical protein ACHAWF_007324, partial [Thalassiosira exigua]
SPVIYAQKRRRKSASSARREKARKAEKGKAKREKRAKSNQSDKGKKEMGAQRKNKKDLPLPMITGIKDPIPEMEKKQEKEVPRAFLAPTASRHVYISRCAVIDERTGEMHVDPTTLFSEVASAEEDGGEQNKRRKRPVLVPHTFNNSHFQYFPPSSFPNHEPPTDGTPEVAFLGRSNTGKSSLINALSKLILRAGGGGNRDAASGGGELARTSKRPGRTRTINFFGLVPNDRGDSSSSIQSKQSNANRSILYLVDLPGFGYAAARDEDVDEWQKKTQEFLISRATVLEKSNGGTDEWYEEESSKRSQIRSFGSHGTGPPLKRLYLLIDSRLPEPPLVDLTVMGWCDQYGIPYTIVLTKVDGTSRANCVKLTNQMCMRFHLLYMEANQDAAIDGEVDKDTSGDVFMDPVVYWTSAKEGLGMEELLMSVENNIFSAHAEGEDDAYYDDNGDYDVDLESEDIMR